jgi:hypothetical protein
MKLNDQQINSVIDRMRDFGFNINNRIKIKQFPNYYLPSDNGTDATYNPGLDLICVWRGAFEGEIDINKVIAHELTHKHQVEMVTTRESKDVNYNYDEVMERLNSGYNKYIKFLNKNNFNVEEHPEGLEFNGVDLIPSLCFEYSDINFSKLLNQLLEIYNITDKDRFIEILNSEEIIDKPSDLSNILDMFSFEDRPENMVDILTRYGDPFAFYIELGLWDEVDNDNLIDYQINQIHQTKKRNDVSDEVEQRFIELINNHKNYKKQGKSLKEIIKVLLNDHQDYLLSHKKNE